MLINLTNSSLKTHSRTRHPRLQHVDAITRLAREHNYTLLLLLLLLLLLCSTLLCM